MKRILSLLMSLVFAVGLLGSMPFLNKYEISGGITAVAADEQYTFNTIKGGSTKTYFVDYDVTINVFGRDNCYNTQSLLQKIIELDIDEMQGVKVNFIDIDRNSKADIEAFANLFEESYVDFCYDTGTTANSVMWSYAHSVTSNGSVTLPVVAFINGDGSIRNVTSGTLSDFYLLGIINGNEAVDETISFDITGIENYTYAKSVFNQINSLRSSLGLDELTLDKNLMEIAMQRAAEISVFYSHTRPNDTSCFSFSVAGNVRGENIASGYTSPEDVMYGWTNSSGHYANMVNSGYNAVGVGCFKASDGTLCWVQYFSGGSTPQSAIIIGSEKITRTITAKVKNLDFSIVNNLADASVAKAGDSVEFGVINRNVGFTYQTQELSSSDFTFKSSDEDVVEINSSGAGIVKGNGTTEITATLKSNTDFVVSQKVTVGHTHSFTHYYSNNDATCASDGTKTAYCDYYGCTEQDVIKDKGTRLAHSYVWTTTKKATVYSEGKKQKECSVCGYVTKTVAIDQLKCSKPTLKSIENTEYGVLTKWGKVKGADRYRVYRKTSKTEWEYIGYTTNTYYTDKTAKSGTKYYYAVKAINEAGSSSRSGALSKYYLADPTLKAISNSEYGVRISWGKITGAEKYSVYRKTSSGSYSKIGTTSKAYYTDKNAKSGRKYYYIVKAVKGSATSASSNAKSILHLADPTLKTPSSTKSGITLKWTKVAGAEGYVIYRKTGSGSYTKLKTEKGISNLSYRDKSAKKGKTYTYKVKAYKSKTYSAYSNTKQITDEY